MCYSENRLKFHTIIHPRGLLQLNDRPAIIQGPFPSFLELYIETTHGAVRGGQHVPAQYSLCKWSSDIVQGSPRHVELRFKIHVGSPEVTNHRIRLASPSMSIRSRLGQFKATRLPDTYLNLECLHLHVDCLGVLGLGLAVPNKKHKALLCRTLKPSPVSVSAKSEMGIARIVENYLGELFYLC